MRTSWIIQVDPKSNDKCSYKIHREKGRVKLETDSGVRQPQDKECLAPQRWKGRGWILPGSPHREDGQAHILMVSITVREYILIVLSLLTCGTLLCSPRKLSHTKSCNKACLQGAGAGRARRSFWGILGGRGRGAPKLDGCAPPSLPGLQPVNP